MMALRYDGTNIEHWLDDFCVMRTPASISPVNTLDFMVNFVYNTSLTGNYAIAEMALYNTALSFADMLVAYNAMKYNNSALPMADATFLVTEGDSISTMVNGAVPFNQKYAKSTPCFGINFAVQASKLSPDCTNRAPSLDATLPSNLKTPIFRPGKGLASPETSGTLVEPFGQGTPAEP
jgi:hypothetical protein